MKVLKLRVLLKYVFLLLSIFTRIVLELLTMRVAPQEGISAPFLKGRKHTQF